MKLKTALAHLRRHSRDRSPTPVGEGGDNAGGGESEYVDGGTFTMSMAVNPASSDLQSRRAMQLFTVNQLALRQPSRPDDQIQSQLATDREGRRRPSPHPLARDHADGRDFTHRAVADNIAYAGTRKNKSPHLRTFLPVGATAKADDAAGTGHHHACAARAVQASTAPPARR